MLNRLFSILALSLVTCGAYAATVDNCNLPECRELKVRLDARIQKLQAGIAPAFGSIVKNDATSKKYCSDGSQAGEICYMTHQNAIDYCASQQSHLPSAREMAQLSASFGAEGIIFACYNNERNCKHIEAESLDRRSIDEFNFSISGYSRPEGDFGKNWFWSSSVNPNFANNRFYFNGLLGEIASRDFRNNTNAVLCVAGR